MFSIPQADDVEGKIRQIIPPGFCTNTNDFLSLLEKETNFKPFGTLLHTYTVPSQTGGETFTFQIHKVKRSSSLCMEPVWDFIFCKCSVR